MKFVGHAKTLWMHASETGRRRARKVQYLKRGYEYLVFFFTGYSVKDIPFDEYAEASGRTCVMDLGTDVLVSDFFYN